MLGGSLRAIVRRRRAFLFVQLPLLLGSIAVLAWRLDVPEALRRLPGIDWRWAAPGLLAFTASKFIHAYRWRVFLWRRRDLSLRALFAIFLASNLANALIPLRAGDLLRIELPSRRFGIPRAELTSSVIVVETLLDAVSFVVLMFVALLLLDVPPIFPSLLAATAALTAVAFAAVVGLAHLDGADAGSWRLLRRLPSPLRRRLATLIPQFVEGMASLRSARRALQAIAISLAAWAMEVGVYWMMGQAFDVDLEAAAYLPVMIGANLIVSLPLTPWDLGPYEVVVAEVAVFAGAARGVASGYAIGSHLLLLIWIGLTGLAAMWLLDLRPREVLRRGQAARELDGLDGREAES